MLGEKLCGHQKGKSTHCSPLNLIKSLKKYSDEYGYSAALPMDLSKAFETINHDLLVTKLHASHTENAMKLKMSYLRKQSHNDLY